MGLTVQSSLAFQTYYIPLWNLLALWSWAIHGYTCVLSDLSFLMLDFNKLGRKTRSLAGAGLWTDAWSDHMNKPPLVWSCSKLRRGQLPKAEIVWQCQGQTRSRCTSQVQSTKMDQMSNKIQEISVDAKRSKVAVDLKQTVGRNGKKYLHS